MGGYVGEYVIVRSRDQGVVCGVLETLTPLPGGLAVAELREASQVHNWRGGVLTLFEASLRGFGVASISEPVQRVLVFGVCGVIPCTAEAERNLREWRTGTSAGSSASPPRATKRRG